MEKYRQKTFIVKSKVEYADYALTLCRGCSHDCSYCYARGIALRIGRIKDKSEWSTPKIADNYIEIIKKEIPKIKRKGVTNVQLSFMSDPFMYGNDEVKKASLETIKLLNDNDIPVRVLTKGILSEELIGLSDKNEYGITLVSLDEAYRTKHEPNTAPQIERVKALRKLHDAGCKTFISMEPYPYQHIVDQNIVDILHEVGFVDKIYFGIDNYCKKPKTKEYIINSTNEIKQFCKSEGIKLHIKDKTNIYIAKKDKPNKRKAVKDIKLKASKKAKVVKVKRTIKSINKKKNIQELLMMSMLQMSQAITLMAQSQSALYESQTRLNELMIDREFNHIPRKFNMRRIGC